ncbi:MAG: hypothetical protein ACREFU_17575 [Acetobacteraceae bacterium]
MPAIARWLSRDPLGENCDPVGNLYRYVEGNPVGLADTLGLVCFPSLANALQLLASNPWLLALALGTKIVGGGPEDLAADAVVAEELAAAEGAAETTTLFRAVTTPELESIQSFNAFTNPAWIEVKYFSTSPEGAQSYASQASTNFHSCVTRPDDPGILHPSK